MARFEEIAQRSSETPESTKALVELQNFIYNSKLEVSFTSRRELAKSAEYLEFLLCYSEVPGKYYKNWYYHVLVVWGYFHFPEFYYRYLGVTEPFFLSNL